MILWREFSLLCKKALYSDKQKKIGIKWKQSILSIFFALLLTSVLILIKGENPLNVFLDIVNGAIRNPESLNEMILYFTMFTLAGLAIIVGFKSGLFNIGIGGQMLISGVVMMILAVKTALPWPILIILGMLIAGVAASISGVLKSLFNIHEVVSTILINWIFFWISQYLLSPEMSWMDSYGTTKELSSISRMKIGTSIILPSLIVTSILLVGFLILFNFTKFGFALKSVGQNTSASKYAGIKVTVQLALGMALSGVAAGALAGVNYLGKFGSMSYSTSRSLPGIGFQGISVALISFNSIWGLIPAALFWAVITSGSNYASIVHPSVPKEILSLMNGFIIYLIAISIIFIRFRPIKLLWLLFIRMKSKEIKAEKEKLKKAQIQQKKLFGLSKQEILKISTNDIEAEIYEKNINRKNILLKIKIIKKEFFHKRKKPKFFKLSKPTNIWPNYWKYIFINKEYKMSKAKFNLDLYNETKSLNIEREKIESEIKKLEKQLKKYLVKENNKNFRVGLKIIENEYKSRKIKITNDLSNYSFIGRIHAKYIEQKNKQKLFEEKYNLLIIAYKENIKIFNNNKEERKKLKLQLNSSIKNIKLETDLNSKGVM